jgi:hypothetical protein
MYNKLVLRNNDAPFVVKFDGVDHNIPTGLFEAESTLWNHIVWQARKWGINLTVEKHPEAPKVTPIEEIKEIKETKDVESVKEETKEVKEPKKKK